MADTEHEDRLPALIGRTMKVASAARNNHGLEEIIKAGELVRARPAKGRSLSLFAQRCLNLMLAEAAGDAWKDRPFTVTKKALRRGHKGNERIDQMLDELMSVTMKIDTVSQRGQPAILTVALLSSNIEEKATDDESLVTFRFSREFAAVMQHSNIYAVLSSATVLALESKYSLKLYEIGCQLSQRRHPMVVLTVPELRELLGIPEGAMKRWPDLRRFVLDRARAEIDQLADFRMTIADSGPEHRSGRKVIRVTLGFWPKDDAGIAAAAAEVARSRVGRRARRQGTTELIFREDDT